MVSLGGPISPGPLKLGGDWHKQDGAVPPGIGRRLWFLLLYVQESLAGLGGPESHQGLTLFPEQCLCLVSLRPGRKTGYFCQCVCVCVCVCVTICWGLNMHTPSPSQRLGQMSLLIDQPSNPSICVLCLSSIWPLPTRALVCSVPGGTGHWTWFLDHLFHSYALEPEVLFVPGSFLAGPPRPSCWT